MKVGTNLKNDGNDLGETYFKEPWENKDPIGIATGPVVAVASVVFESIDQVLAGIADQEIEPPSGPLGRLQRDTKELAKNIVTIRPVKTVVTGLRFGGSAVMDALDLAGGFHQAA